MTAASTRLNGFSPAVALSDTDLVYVDQNGEAKATVAQFKTALAGNRTVETFIAGTNFAAGTTPSLTLAGTYGSIGNIDVYCDGVPQLDCALVGRTLSFNPVIPTGTQQVVVRGGSVRTIGVPADGSVTDAKVASGTKLGVRLQTVNLLDPQFGVKGDGVTDDSAGIQAAINYVLALPNGGRLYAPAPPIAYLVNTPPAIAKTTKAFRFFGDGTATIFKAGSSLPAGPMFNVGLGSSAAGGVDYVISDMSIQPPASGGSNTNGFYCLNANGVHFRRVSFGAVKIGVSMSACFAVRFTSCSWNGTLVQAVYSSTAAHNIIFDKCNGFGVGGSSGQVLRIDGATNNIVMQNCDWESCASVYSLAANSSSVRIVGCYIEYCVNQEFYHQGGCYNIVVDGNWIALNGGGTTSGSGGGTSTYQNWNGGSFKHNSGWNMSIAWDSSVSDVDVGQNYSVGSFNVSPAPFTPVSGFLNSWSSGTHAVGYKKFENGTVEIRGNCTAGTGSLGAVAFTLPAPYRPVQQKVFACVTTSNALAVVIVDVNGNVVPNVPGGAAGAVVNLDGIMFNANVQ